MIGACDATLDDECPSYLRSDLQRCGGAARLLSGKGPIHGKTKPGSRGMPVVGEPADRGRAWCGAGRIKPAASWRPGTRCGGRSDCGRNHRQRCRQRRCGGRCRRSCRPARSTSAGPQACCRHAAAGEYFVQSGDGGLHAGQGLYRILKRRADCAIDAAPVRVMPHVRLPQTCAGDALPARRDSTCEAPARSEHVGRRAARRDANAARGEAAAVEAARLSSSRKVTSRTQCRAFSMLQRLSRNSA